MLRMPPVPHIRDVPQLGIQRATATAFPYTNETLLVACLAWMAMMLHPQITAAFSVAYEFDIEERTQNSRKKSKTHIDGHSLPRWTRDQIVSANNTPRVAMRSVWASSHMSSNTRALKRRVAEFCAATEGIGRVRLTISDRIDRFSFSCVPRASAAEPFVAAAPEKEPRTTLTDIETRFLDAFMFANVGSPRGIALSLALIDNIVDLAPVPRILRRDRSFVLECLLRIAACIRIAHGPFQIDTKTRIVDSSIMLQRARSVCCDVYLKPQNDNQTIRLCYLLFASLPGTPIAFKQLFYLHLKTGNGARSMIGMSFASLDRETTYFMKRGGRARILDSVLVSCISKGANVFAISAMASARYEADGDSTLSGKKRCAAPLSAENA